MAALRALPGKRIKGLFGLLDRRDYIACLATVTSVAILVAVTLEITDRLIQAYDPNYDPIHSPVRAALIFAAIALPFSLYIRIRGWTRVEPSLIAAFSLFIPITFFTLTVAILFEPELLTDPRLTHPGSGQAFAQLIYKRILRALPTVLIVPFAFWWLLTRVFEPRSKQREARNG